MEYYPRGALSFLVSAWALSGASERLEFRECAALLLPRRRFSSVTNAANGGMPNGNSLSELQSTMRDG